MISVFDSCQIEVGAGCDAGLGNGTVCHAVVISVWIASPISAAALPC